MNGRLLAWWSAVIVLVLASASAIVSAQASTETIHLSPEVWILVASVLVTVGVNLEQLRRMRVDVKDIKEGTDERHLENRRVLDVLGRKMDRFEVELRYLRREHREDQEGI